MKFITTNFVKCAVKTCSSSDKAFPLKYEECQVVLDEQQEFNPEFIVHMLDKLNWDALVKVARDLGKTDLPTQKPEGLDPIMEDDAAVLRDLHSLLIQSNIVEGKMVCENCEHIYFIKNSIPNFLLPPHLC
ncbi:Trm112p-domain-containing protein [Yamadazyma tenuis ATCC 10573]|uniref:Multifunctional methyltransferase subunit trm112 n=1 Tax=Candida tenuis (strain ATCC 10573 / BCRC 21748 / CBS 615 / JCM 9827 / NBRC 10315 / NRRL Y-1498 / VKM Y-70) TaxID=590646 RepID=G3B1V0_CANTC|nr:Trm112p-domain-containing protein [Yamadazyma tenuis ATCC 10573]EGV64534.1 Trm112p-domain-containing protein [Yamadazyma tenuis ATCC 10573]